MSIGGQDNTPFPEPLDGASEGGAHGADGASSEGSIPEDLVDRFFDGELDDADRRAFLRGLPGDLDRCEQVAKTRRMLDLLGSGGSFASAPGLTGRIIAAVDKQRGFASRHVRTLARAARLGLAAAVVLVVGAVAAVERVAPDATRLAPAPAPLTSALRESQAEMASTLGSITSTVEAIQWRVGQAMRPGRTPWVHSDGAHSHRTGAQGERRLVVLADSSSAEPRVVTVSFSLSTKASPRGMTWTMEMAPTGASGECSTGLMDAEGRCAAFNTPMGIWRGDGEARGPYVLPGYDLSSVRLRAGSFVPMGRGSSAP